MDKFCYSSGMERKDEIAIIGFGLEGRAVLDYLIKHNYPNVTVCDMNMDIEEEMPDGVSVRFGPDEYLKNLMDFDVIFRSPGVKFLEPAIQTAINEGVYVTSCTDFFMDQCVCPVIGVTGTKGKGTTCTLIYEILKKAGKKVYLGGNIGNPSIELLDKLKGDNLVVLEMSSFQLQDLRKSPHYAVVLNTTTDHLDYHVDRDEYLAAKEALLINQNAEGVAVFNRDYEYVKYYEGLVKGAVREVSVEEEVNDGAYTKDNEIWYSSDGKAEKIMKVSDIALIGSHNLENVMPAVVIAKELGVASKDIVAAVKNFTGLPYRLELVREVAGVKYYNDSFSTTSETSMAAVDSFDEPTVLIAGGFDKGLDYGQWAVKILTKPSLKTVILVGDTADKMEDEIVEAEEKLGSAEGSPTKVLRRDDLEEAVLEAYTEASDGWVVVMSPAASSFDQFASYKERGEKFIEIVKQLR